MATLYVSKFLVAYRMCHYMCVCALNANDPSSCPDTPHAMHPWRASLFGLSSFVASVLCQIALVWCLQSYHAYSIQCVCDYKCNPCLDSTNSSVANSAAVIGKIRVSDLDSLEAPVSNRKSPLSTTTTGRASILPQCTQIVAWSVLHMWGMWSIRRCDSKCFASCCSLIA